MTGTAKMRKTLFAAAALSLLAASAQAQTVDGPKVNWKMGSWGKPRAVTAGQEMLKKHVEERTGGNFTITIGYESFGGPKELLDLLKVGGLQATLFCSSYHPDKTPAYTGLDLPFIPVADADAQERVHEAFHKHPYIVKELANWNATVFTSNLLPQYEFMGKGKPPKALDDWKGLRVRAIGGIGDAMKRLGAVPTSMDSTEVYTALERGVVDAVSLPSPYAHAAFKLYEISKWYTDNLSPGTQACPTGINLDALKALPEQYRKLIDEAKPKAYAALKAAYKASEEKDIPLFRKRNLEFVHYSDADLAAFRKVAAQPVWDDWVQAREAQGIPGRELLNVILDAAKESGKS